MVNFSHAEVLVFPFITVNPVSIDTKKRVDFLEACLVLTSFPLVQLQSTDYKGKTCKMCVFDRHLAYDRRIRILD